METLTKILENSSIGEVGASRFAKEYYAQGGFNLQDKYEFDWFSNQDRTDLKALKQRFVSARANEDCLIVISHDSHPRNSLVAYGDSNHLMKKCFLLPFFRESSKDNAIRYKATPEKKFHSALNFARLEDRFVGYDFIGITDNQVKTVSFTDCIEGKLMAGNYMVELDGNDYNVHNRAIERGGKINAHVHSSSEDKKYGFRIDNVPMKFKDKPVSKDAHALWFDISSNHDCDKVNYGGLSFYRYVKNLKMNSISERHVKNEMKLCQHVVAAVKAYNGIRSSTQVVMDPFVEFSDKAMGYYNKLKRSTLMEVHTEEGIKLRALDEVNVNLLMYDFIKLNPKEVYFRK